MVRPVGLGYNALVVFRARFTACAGVLVGALIGLGSGCPAPASGRLRARRGPAPDPDLARMPPLIPRSQLLAGPGRARVRLSPDGRRVAFLGAHHGRVALGVLELDSPGARPRFPGQHVPPVRSYVWAPDGKSLLCLVDRGGRERSRLYRCPVTTGDARALTPKGVQAVVLRRSLRHPQEVLVRMNQRDPRAFDVYRLDVQSGQLALDTRNPGRMVGWVSDFDYRLRAGRVVTPDGRVRLVVRDTVRSPWRTLRTWPSGAEGWPFLFSPDGRSVYLFGNRGHDKLRLMRVELATGTAQEVYADPRADLPRQALVSPRDGRLEAVGVEREKLRWHALLPRVRSVLARLQRLAGRSTFKVLGRSRDDSRWLVAVDGDRSPGRLYLLDRPSGRLRLLFHLRPSLRGLRLARSRAITVRARDGLRLPGYLTRPPGRRQTRVPTVLLVHGGPWARDRWGWHPWVQWLANRGYLVLQVNYRGSRGYGKRFLNAGDREWGRKMQQDLEDAVRWAVKRGLADPRRVAILGWSYGGYAALAGVVTTPRRYAAAVDVVGPSNLITLLQGLPTWWAPLRGLFYRRVGHPVRDAAMLRARSPWFHAARVRTPLLIFQGANDPRVPRRESDQMVAAIRRARGRVSYVVYPDEGHGLARPENRLDMAARTEHFLARHLGGRAEPPRSNLGSSAEKR